MDRRVIEFGANATVPAMASEEIESEVMASEVMASEVIESEVIESEVIESEVAEPAAAVESLLPSAGDAELQESSDTRRNHD